MPNLSCGIDSEHSHSEELTQKGQRMDQIFFKLFTERSTVGTRMTYSTRESGGFTCSICRKPAGSCNCVTIRPGGGSVGGGSDLPTCSLCGGLIGYSCKCRPSGGGSTGSGGTGGSTVGSGGHSGANVKIPFPSDSFPGYGADGMDCFHLSDYILHKILGNSANVGEVGDAYFIKKSDDKGNVIITGNAKAAVDIINNHLDANRPLKVGVDYRVGGNKSDHLTDHWIVVNGRGYDSERQLSYFIYIETGRSKNMGASAVGDNRLYYDTIK